MNRDFFSLSRCCVVLGAILICFWELRDVYCQDTAKGSLQSLVVLKNMNVITGVARANFEKTIVEQPNGSRIVLMTDQVALICDSYDEVFEFQRSQLDPGDHNGHEQLFRWCIRYQQLDAAQRLIDDLQFTRMSPQTLEALNTQLVASRAAQTRTQTPTNSASVQIAKTAMTSDANRNAGTSERIPSSNEPVEDSMVQLAAFSSNTPAGNVLASPQSVTARELEAALRHMPEFGISSFKRVVEPILAKNCANAGCHQRQSETFPLMTMGAGVAIPRRMSQQNLYQVLRYVGDGLPESSPLLDRALTAHGPQDVPAVKFETREHLVLLEWVQLMAEPARQARIPQTMLDTENTIRSQNDRPSIEKAAILQVGAIPTSTPTDSMSPFDRIASPASQLPAKADGASEIRQVSHIQSNAPPTIPDLRSKGRQSQVSDPFDPEVFNREFFNKKPLLEKSFQEPSGGQTPTSETTTHDVGQISISNTNSFSAAGSDAKRD